MKKTIIVLLIGITVLMCGCLTENNGVPQNNPKEDSSIEKTKNALIENTQKNVKVIKRINTFEELEPTANYQLKAGETYVYHLYDNFMGDPEFPCDPVEIDVGINVEKIERINKSDYYVLTSKRYEAYPACYPTIGGQVKQIYVGKPEKPGDIPNPIIYGGCVMGVNKDNLTAERIRLAENFAICYFIQTMQDTWMFYLDENIEIVRNVTAKSALENKEYTDVMEITVQGSEKINGRDCFKVEVISRSNYETGDMKEVSKDIYLVDKEKRITVQFEGYDFYHDGAFLKIRMELKEIKN